MRFVLELVLEVVGQAVLEPIFRPVGRALSSPWRAFVRRLTGPRVLLLCAVALAAMPIAWSIPGPETSDFGVLLAMGLCMGAPMLAIFATVEWRHKRRRERMHSRRLRRSAY